MIVYNLRWIYADSLSYHILKCTEQFLSRQIDGPKQDFCQFFNCFKIFNCVKLVNDSLLTALDPAQHFKLSHVEIRRTGFE